MKMRLPNWDKWKLFPTLTATEAVALTLNIDPKDAEFRGLDNFDYASDNFKFPARFGHMPPDIAAEFEERLFLFKRHFDGKLALGKLSGWALSVEWSIPPELDALSDGFADVNTAPPVGVGTIRHKLRANSLDVPIAKAIKQAESLVTGAVFLELRELAIGGEKPFTGYTEDGALCYTNDAGKPAKLTKDALGKRLRNHGL